MPDDPALVGFCQAVHPRLIAALMVTTRDRWVAEEVAQETVVRVCERWVSVRDMDQPEGWAFRVALNLVRSRWRRAATAARVLRRLQADADGSAEQPDVVTRDWVRAAVDTLPPRQRQVIALRYYAGLPVADTAVAMGCAEGTVKSLTAKATAALRTRLGEGEEGAHRRAPLVSFVRGEG